MKRNLFKPTEETNLTIQNLRIEDLLNKSIRVLLLDVDGTLLPRSESKLHQSVKEWIIEAKKYLPIHLLSNNPSKKRIELIANELDLDFTHKAYKPRTKNTLKVVKRFDCDFSNIAIIGDRIFTDIIIGNRLGFHTILVCPVDKNGLSSSNNYIQQIEKYLLKILGES